MLTLSNYGGRRLIQFDLDGGVRTVRLGKIAKADAEAIRSHFKWLLTARRFGQPVPPATAKWASQIDDELYERISKTGLIEPRIATSAGESSENPFELGRLFDGYIKKRTDLKPRTISNLKQARHSAVGHFGERYDIRRMNRGDASDWHIAVRAKKYATATIGMFIKKTRQVLADAVDHHLIPANPFDKLKAKSGINRNRHVYVRLSAMESVFAFCPDLEWKVIFAMGRFGGIRIPSELFPLELDDVDWEHDRIIITSPKTEHHDGRETREIPIFPELKPFLLELFNNAPAGTTHIISLHRNVNLRTMAEKIVRRAGLKPWPKIFQNLRSTRETELLRAGFPLHVVCDWIGNSPAVAKASYAQLIDEDFEEAASRPSTVPFNPKSAAESAADRSGQERTKAEPAHQNPRKTGENGGPDYPIGESNSKRFVTENLKSAESALRNALRNLESETGPIAELDLHRLRAEVAPLPGSPQLFEGRRRK